MFTYPTTFYQTVSGGASNGLLNNLVAAYEMNSDATDETWTYDATATNITWDTTNKKIGTASGSYNGTSSIIEVPDLNLDAWDFTLCSWFRIPTDDNLRHQIFAIHSTGSFANKIEVYIGNNSESDTIRCVMRDWAAGGTTFGGSTNYKTGDWFQTIVTRTASTWFVEVFINGVSVASQTDATENKATLWPEYDIGAFKVWATLYNEFIGNIDQTLYYNAVLDSTRIAALYNSWDWLAYADFTV